MTKKFLFLAVLWLGCAEIASSQSFYNIRRNRNLMVNAGSGIAYYKGDLVNPGDLGFVRPNITLGAEYYFTRRISARAQLTWFQIKGDDVKADDDRDQRNLDFFSNNIELSATGAISLIPQGMRYYERSKINIHGFAGIALLRFNPKTTLDGEKYALRKYQTEGVAYNRLQPVIPVGIGARLNISPFFNILIEGGYRFTFTDYLDDVSKRNYVPLDALGLSRNDDASYQDIRFRLSDRRYEPGGQHPGEPFPNIDEEVRTRVGVRGNPENNDGYFLLNISLQYYLPKEIFRDSQRKLYTVKRKATYRKPSRRR